MKLIKKNNNDYTGDQNSKKYSQKFIFIMKACHLHSFSNYKSRKYLLIAWCISLSCLSKY